MYTYRRGDGTPSTNSSSDQVKTLKMILDFVSEAPIPKKCKMSKPESGINQILIMLTYSHFSVLLCLYAIRPFLVFSSSKCAIAAPLLQVFYSAEKKNFFLCQQLIYTNIQRVIHSVQQTTQKNWSVSHSDDLQCSTNNINRTTHSQDMQWADILDRPQTLYITKRFVC